MRVPIVAGNWKMYKTVPEAIKLTEDLLKLLDGTTGVRVVLCPPFTALSALGGVLEGTPIALGAQNMHHEKEGAFTGEISAEMLLTTGCKYVILGHSERRTHFGETDETVNRKVVAALSAGLVPVVCVGETLAERKAEETDRIVERQVRGAFRGICSADMRTVVVAYEPVWAIGTGLTATPSEAQKVHGLIRSLLGKQISGDVPIQYGGSVKPENACELFAQPDIDGGLIGGASLKADSFAAIVKSAAAVGMNPNKTEGDRA